MPLRILLVAVLLSFAATAQAEEDPPRHRFGYDVVMGARVNPAGAAVAADVGYSRRLFDSRSILLKDSFAGLFLVPEVTPSNYRLGVAAVVEPLAVLRLRAAVAYGGYFGTWDELQSYEGPGADWSPEARELGGEAGRNYTGTGLWATLGGRLQAKVGPVAVRNGLRFIRTSLELAEGDTVYYDSTLDLLVPGDGWSFVNEADLLFLGWEGWIVGLRHVATGAVHEAPHDGLTTHRLGPVILRTFEDRGRRFSSPTVALVTGWWLSHPYRTGASVSRAVPYLTLAFAFNGDLF